LRRRRDFGFAAIIISFAAGFSGNLISSTEKTLQSHGKADY
jgi:hypothetical protein